MRVPSIALALSAAAFTLPALPAAAADGQMAVSYSDLNLTSEHGQRVLARRIDSAARAICKMDGIQTGTLLPNSQARACYERAKATATEQIAERVAQDKRG